MPRLLFITERFPPDIGGLSTSSARISRSIANLGIDVDVLAWSRHVPAGKLGEQALDEDAPQTLKVYRQGMYRQWDMTMPSTLNVLEWLHEQHNYDAVWGHYLSPAGFLAVWFAQLHGLKSIVSARGNDVDTEIFPPGDMSRLLWTLNKATIVNSVSQDMARKIEILCGRQDLEIMPNVVDASVFSPRPERVAELKSSLKIKDEEKVLCFSGELREKKGLQFMLDAFQQVQSQTPCCFLVIGDLRSHQRPAVQIFAAEHPEAAERLIITGHLEQAEDVAAHLSLCDIFLQPSLMEGMPNSLLEAMACSCLCIASDAGGIPEIIQHGENGFLLSRAQLNYLGTGILEALELDEGISAIIKQTARDRVVALFSPEQETSQIEAMLQRLLSSSS